MAIALVLVAPGVAQADINVNTNADAPGDGDCIQTSCKLRDAVTVALRTGEIIRVPAGTYQLTEGAITLDGVQIVGDGALTTIIDGRDMSGVFRAAQGTNSISGLTITNGSGTYGQFVGGGGSSRRPAHSRLGQRGCRQRRARARRGYSERRHAHARPYHGRRQRREHGTERPTGSRRWALHRRRLGDDHELHGERQSRCRWRECL